MNDAQELMLHFKPSATIGVWCEYDINGQFGNSNEALVTVVSTNGDDLNEEMIDRAVRDHIIKMTGLSDDEIEDLYGWRHIESIFLGAAK